MASLGQRVIFRADASLRIGTGHVVRCLTLAETLARRGATVEFVCRVMDGDLVDRIEERGFTVRRLPRLGSDASAGVDPSLHARWRATDWRTDAEQTMASVAASGARGTWIVTDHYGLDWRWQRHVRSQVARVFVIDDLANRRHDADLLLDQNYAAVTGRYAGLVPTRCRVLEGPRFALLEDDYRAARSRMRRRTGACNRLMVFFGGADITNETSRLLRAIAISSLRALVVDVVIGDQNPHRKEVAELVARLPSARLHVQLSNLAGLMASADLAIGAGGTATWERCCLGLPSVLVATAANQMPTLRALADDGIVMYLGRSADVTEADYVEAISRASDPTWLRRVAGRCQALVDGQGVERVARAMGLAPPEPREPGANG